jgi:topoisomerase-4 subunit A
VDYLKSLIKRYKKEYPRRTKIDTFKALDVRKLTSDELSINIDSEKGFLGHSVKGESLLNCSSLDKLLIVKNDGTFAVMPPPETYYVDDSLIWCGIYKRDLVFTAVYTDWGVTYVKRFEIGGVIMNRDYNYIPEKAQLQLCKFGTPESIYVKYKPVKGLRIHQQEFEPEQVLIKGVKAKGRQMTSKIIDRIDTSTGRWWDKKLCSPKGLLI